MEYKKKKKQKDKNTTEINGSLKLFQALKYEYIHVLQALPCLLKEDSQRNKRQRNKILVKLSFVILMYVTSYNSMWFHILLTKMTD